MTQENYSPERFQEWLSDQMEARDWSQAKLAREIDVFKGTVGRWLMPADSEMHRRPSFESARRLADLFGVDLRFVLDLVGILGHCQTAGFQLRRELQGQTTLARFDGLSGGAGALLAAGLDV